MELRALMDLHTHTLASGHAYSTLKENLEEAKKMGLEVLGTSEHARMMPGTAPLIYFQNFKVIPKEVDGVRLVNGIEANIFDEHGSIDVEEPILSKMDYIIASLHTPCIANLGIVKNTAALVGAAENPNVTVIGHPDDDRYPICCSCGKPYGHRAQQRVVKSAFDEDQRTEKYQEGPGGMQKVSHHGAHGDGQPYLL